MNTTSRRIGGLAGLAFVGTVFTVNIIQGAIGQPMAGASKSEVFDFYNSHGGVADIINAIAPIAWITLMLFAAGMVAAMRGHERRSGDSWSLAGLGGAVMQCAVFPGVVAAQAALTSGELSDDAAWSVWMVHNALFALNGMSLAIVLTAFAIGGVRAGLLAPWQRTVGLTGAALLAGSAMLTPVSLGGSPTGLLGFAGFLVWLVFVGSASLRLVRTSAPAAAEAPTAQSLVTAS